jgi:hypothetical protein
MSRVVITLTDNASRRKASDWVYSAPPMTRLEFKQARRTIEQNAKLWAMLTDIAEQVEWHGLRLGTNDWKLMFMDALKREMRAVPNLDGNGFVNLGVSTSALSKTEMADLIEIIHAFGAAKGVEFRDTVTAN